MDPTSGAAGNEKILEGAPKVIAVPGDVALQGTYLNDIRLSPDGRTGYITDSRIVTHAVRRAWRI